MAARREDLGEHIVMQTSTGAVRGPGRCLVR